MKRQSRPPHRHVPAATAFWFYLAAVAIEVLLVFVFVSFQLAEIGLVAHTRVYTQSAGNLPSDHDPWD